MKFYVKTMETETISKEISYLLHPEKAKLYLK
jgi:hypothetical protein